MCTSCPFCSGEGRPTTILEVQGMVWKVSSRGQVSIEQVSANSRTSTPTHRHSTTDGSDRPTPAYPRKAADEQQSHLLPATAPKRTLPACSFPHCIITSLASSTPRCSNPPTGHPLSYLPTSIEQTERHTTLFGLPLLHKARQPNRSRIEGPRPGKDSSDLLIVVPEPCCQSFHPTNVWSSSHKGVKL